VANQYKGMRWLKCDLHMHTPADSRHWQGDRLIQGQEREAARKFAQACHEAGLDVVGITDHNFLSKGFLPFLKKAFEEIENQNGHRITLFPGFEFEADVGKGMHVLCLFEPGADLGKIDHILTLCGIPPPREVDGGPRKSQKKLRDIFDIIQKPRGDGGSIGIVIVPHVFEDSLFDRDRISEWLQQEEFRNPDLLAVEVPKPVNQMSPSFQKLFSSGEGCLQEWKRIRPIATLMSSDAKKLIERDSEDRPVPNSIGYRYTWIKMSEPSIESLRQAFLDHGSRIILPEDVAIDIHPEKRIGLARIKSISIKRVAFLDDQEIHFSPNMNCIIGGRGSGKSTILEYLRILMGKDAGSDIDKDTRGRIDRIRKTLEGNDAEVSLDWISAEGVEDTIVWRNGQVTVDGPELIDQETFFARLPIRFYSQQQLNHLTESTAENGRGKQAQRLLELIDGFVKSDLIALEDKEREIKRDLEDTCHTIHKAEALEEDYRRLQQEHLELERQWKARSEIQDATRRHQHLRLEQKYIDDVHSVVENLDGQVTKIIEEVAEKHAAFKDDEAPHAGWFRVLDEKIRAAIERFAQTMPQLVTALREEIERYIQGDPEWTNILEELEKADERFQQACKEKGLSTDDVGRLQEIERQKSDKYEEMTQLRTRIDALKEDAGDPEKRLSDLHEIWEEQYKRRSEAAIKANNLAILGESRTPFIKVTVEYQQDWQDFMKAWLGFAPADGRTRLGKNWEEIGKVLYRLFSDRGGSASPWEVLKRCVDSENPTERSELEGFITDLSNHIQKDQERWEQLRRTRVRDSVDMTLYRTDRSIAGSISKGSLSDGQRNTAALTLLLAQEGGPLVIDQPEEDIDSNFLFSELIPMFRKVKVQRQLILAASNANLPVNGDCELVYALEAKEGRGQVCAQGGLDQTAVIRAVLDIMEGTEEAFRRRREKYHF